MFHYCGLFLCLLPIQKCISSSYCIRTSHHNVQMVPTQITCWVIIYFFARCSINVLHVAYFTYFLSCLFCCCWFACSVSHTSTTFLTTLQCRASLTIFTFKPICVWELCIFHSNWQIRGINVYYKENWYQYPSDVTKRSLCCSSW